MNRKMTRFAFAAKCGAFGASGSSAARQVCESRSARAIAPRPTPQSRRNQRRVMASGEGIMTAAPGSFHFPHEHVHQFKSFGRFEHDWTWAGHESGRSPRPAVSGNRDTVLTDVYADPNPFAAAIDVGI